MKNIDIAKNLIKKFNDNNYELYLVGGSVRDYLIYSDFDDFDFASNLTPSQIISFLNIEKYDKFAIKFGTVKFKYLNKNIEITTFRKESNYKDHRHPDNIIFIKDMKLDSIRRDFDINSLYMDNNKIYDFYNGLESIKNHTIKFIIDPNISINTDPLRVLRYFRFVINLNLKTDEKLDTFLKSNLNLLDNISTFKIKQELSKFKDQNNLILNLKKYNLFEYLSKYFN